MIFDSGLTDTECELIKDLISIASNIKISRRLLMSAVFYIKPIIFPLK